MFKEIGLLDQKKKGDWTYLAQSEYILLCTLVFSSRLHSGVAGLLAV